MKVVIDIETDSLVNPKHIHLIVCKDINTGTLYKFKDVKDEESSRFYDFAGKVTHWIGHNLLGFDRPILRRLLHCDLLPLASCVDTFILSKLIDFSRDGHSIENYGEEFGIPKGVFKDFSKYSPEMEEYCIRDVEICHRIFKKYKKYIDNPIHQPAIELEHQFQEVVNSLHNNGFAFNVTKAEGLLKKVTEDLAILDKDILEAFPPRLKLIREITPKETKFGTLSRTDFRWLKDADISEYNGGPFCRCEWTEFNPSSHKQLITVLNDAGWSPVDKTQSHIDAEREYGKLRYKKGNTELDLRKKELIIRLDDLKKTGWKVNEKNLETLPAKAPLAARLLAKRILLEARRRSLTEWLELVQPDGRIHGKFLGIGAWTHRMAHQSPNTANIPNEFDTAGKKKLLGKELRSLWCAGKNRLLVGVDAEGIQLRIFAHYINEPDFTQELLNGDPHTLNQNILGAPTRDAAKRFIYALLLGAGLGKLAEILQCGPGEAEEALNRLLQRYQGFARLKSEVIPRDAARGWFPGLDGRSIRIPGDTVSQRRHLAMSGYLQSGEAVIMKRATMKWFDKLKEYDASLVNFVHDEWQVECPNNMTIALEIANMMSNSLEKVGQELKLNCPLSGSFWNKKAKDYTIDKDWSKTH